VDRQHRGVPGAGAAGDGLADEVESPAMSATLDELMGQASAALARQKYAECERLCVEALALARRRSDWDYYARVLLPLQESRRQKRIIAAEGTIRLGTADLDPDPGRWFDRLPAGCVVLTRPHTAAAARELASLARRASRCVEVLWADCAASESQWTLRAAAGPAAVCVVASPPAEWIDRWLGAESRQVLPPLAGRTPADWFLDAREALGDEALRQVRAIPGSVEHMDELESCLDIVADHELIHQHLAAAARALARGGQWIDDRDSRTR
jgi:hypothetical protein